MSSGESSFERWLEATFGRPGDASPPHGGEAGADPVLLRPDTALAYVTRLFSSAGTILGDFGDAQLNRDLWELVGASGDLHPMLGSKLPWPDRARAIASISGVFETLFAERCTPHLSHTFRTHAEQPADLGALNSACYMWWDIFPTWGRPDDAVCTDRDAALLDVMARTLTLDSPACRESALHGLGHWHLNYPSETERLIDRFLAFEGVPGAGPGGAELDPALEAYALAARTGCVQ